MARLSSARRMRGSVKAAGGALLAGGETQHREEEDPMAQSILYPRLRGLLDDGAQLVEVLPEQEYAEQHLPGAINLPLKQLDAATTAQLDKRRAVVVYCWDAL